MTCGMRMMMMQAVVCTSIPSGSLFQYSRRPCAHRHPYRHEIKHIDYPEHMFQFADPIAPKSFEETPFTWVADSTVFNAMLDKLRSAREIAIDLEYHSYRSFYGFVCLMQLSTRDEDWVVDTLAVREELEELNEVFTDPNIVKVRSAKKVIYS